MITANDISPSFFQVINQMLEAKMKCKLLRRMNGELPQPLSEMTDDQGRANHHQKYHQYHHHHHPHHDQKSAN